MDPLAIGCVDGKLVGSRLSESDISTVGGVLESEKDFSWRTFTGLSLWNPHLSRIVCVPNGRLSKGAWTIASMATPSNVQWGPKVRISCCEERQGDTYRSNLEELDVRRWCRRLICRRFDDSSAELQGVHFL